MISLKATKKVALFYNKNKGAEKELRLESSKAAQKIIVRSPFKAKHHVVVQYMAR